MSIWETKIWELLEKIVLSLSFLGLVAVGAVKYYMLGIMDSQYVIMTLGVGGLLVGRKVASYNKQVKQAIKPNNDINAGV